MGSAIDAMLAVRPVLVGVEAARDALGLRARELLHAGPPFADPRHPPAALVSSIVMTCLHEGWARDEAQAEALLRRGALTLIPAQSRDCVTPLAAVVAPNTPLFRVRDAGNDGATLHAPVSVVRGADTRMGTRDGGLLARLAARDRETAPALRALLQRVGALDLWTPALHGLSHGDDLHSRTAAANEAFAAAVREHGDAALAEAIAATPLFFLTPWMAAAALILRAGEGRDLPRLVSRAGGNGERFAIALAGAPERWIACAATPPQGPFIPSAPQGTPVLGAVGDSAVIDMLGLGGQRLAHAPEPFGLVQSRLDADHGERARRLLLAPHPGLPQQWPIGVDVRRVVSQANPPFVMLAMIAADGKTGFLGRGGYRPPLDLFEEAARGAL
ncbi:MAG TPA: DUF1116 domain-containing protein [Burkholderiaceae bacterium]